MIQWLESRIWQVATGVATSIAAALLVSSGVLVFQKIGLEREVAKLESSNATLRVNLADCRRNGRALEDAIEGQNGKIQEMSARSSSKLAEAAQQVEAARGEASRLQRHVLRLLDTPILGDTACQRIESVDLAVQDAFK